ncbi:unnamed protein product [Cladocopium goreaui]|uniref:Uncharacterized protein n=1 Tax=Cladocopium goreaui TaxID=2562237 RepID=A0A9P1C7S1_9DINO|nr:unnamed protein product [Cladocopium goreaui]
MAVRPESVEDWCQIMPNLLEEEGWKTALAQEGSALMHSSCPWGGYLIKFELKGLTVHNAPADSSKVIVRPEVRALLQGTCPIPGISVQSLDVMAPGEAVVQASTSWSIMRLCSVLFGDMVGQVMDYLCDDAPMAWHQKVGRNYPNQGDSSCSFWMEDSNDKPHECLILVRPETATEKFTAFVIVRVHENHFARWASEHFRSVLSSARSTAESYLNRPGIVELREMDEQFYVVISMQSFKRGMPLLPAYPDEHCLTEIDAGERFGLRRWVRYEPRSTKFQLAQYLPVFMERLGFEIGAYNSLDGQKLVPYQCVVRRADWEQMRSRFLEAYPLQKTAYRRANGGSGSPGVHEDVLPKFVTSTALNIQERMDQEAWPKLVVRKTFLDLEEDDTSSNGSPKVRPPRRPKTTHFGRLLVPSLP